MKGSNPSGEDTNMDAALQEAAALRMSAHNRDASFRSMQLLSKGGYGQN